MYTDGFFTRFNYLRKGGVGVDTTNAGEILNYLVDGLQVDDDAVVHVVMKMTGSGYSDIEIADHLGVRESRSVWQGEQADDSKEAFDKVQELKNEGLTEVQSPKSLGFL